MAQRRMFSKSITNSGKFLKMPPTSRLLYYDLGMNADDDGYTEWFTVIRMTGSTEQDLRVLEANGFVRIFDDNVLIILDWKENNYIQKDRYQPSKYLDKYTYTEQCIPVVYKNPTDCTPSIGKDRLGKERLEREALPPTLTLLEKLEPYKEKVSSKILNDFYTYWSEPDATGKERWQLERFFDIPRRLAIWKRREEESFRRK